MLDVLLLGCCINLVLVLLIKAGHDDTDHVFDFFTNIEPTLVGGKDCLSPINSEGSFFSLGFGKAGCIVVPYGNQIYLFHALLLA